MRVHVVAFCRNEQGLTMVEYAVAGTLITAGAVAAFTFLGDAIAVRIFALAALVGLGI
jgi:pilus assembly protein Flp/PilA